MSDGPACPRCDAQLPPSFPGVTVTCTCGERVVWSAQPKRVSTTPREPTRGAVVAGPYRSVGGASDPSVPATCPYCSNEVPPLVRICPHCDVRLDHTRCGRCYSLQAPGNFACGRCGAPLELEPMLDATDAPCPRCRAPLEAAGGDVSVSECARCGGIFVVKEALVRILAVAEVSGPVGKTAPASLTEVRYLPCPQCHTTMNRVNFGRASGVIVDVCRTHGTWFDPGDLTRVIAFVGSGGLIKARARENEAARAAQARLAAERAELVPLDENRRFESSLELLREVVTALFS